MLDGRENDEPLSSKRIYTTGEAARVCKVSQQTIIRCFDAGRLQGFRVPGSRFRRIPREELVRFMRANGIPLENLEEGRKRILIVDDDPRIVELLTDLLGTDPRFEVRSAGTGYDAGLLTESFRPHLMILDYMLPDVNGTLVCRRLRENPAHRGTRILCVSGVVREEEIKALRDAGADDFMHKPFDVARLVERIAQLLEVENEGRSARAN